MFDSTRHSRGMAIRPTNKGIKNKIDRQTEQKLKGGSNNSFSREIFSFGEFLRSKHFFKNCDPYCIRGQIRLEVDKFELRPLFVFIFKKF